MWIPVGKLGIIHAKWGNARSLVLIVFYKRCNQLMMIYNLPNNRVRLITASFKFLIYQLSMVLYRITMVLTGNSE